MSITKNLGRSATFAKPSDSAPVGFGVWKVPSVCQRSSHASSISWASAGVYRWGGTSPVDSVPCELAVWLMVRAPGWSDRRRTEKNPSRRRGRRADVLDQVSTAGEGRDAGPHSDDTPRGL